MEKVVKNTVKHVVVPPDVVGQRIDNFLLSRLEDVPRSQAYRLIRTGQVRVNSGRIRPDYRLKANDSVRIPFFKEPRKPMSAPEGVKKELLSRIVHEDKHLLILNKPCGMAVHGGSGIKLGVIEALRSINPEWLGLELVHRLDRETSGLLILAKTRKMLVFLHEALREGTLTKIYHALVIGQWKGPKLVTLPLTKNTLQSGARVVKVDPEGKPSETAFKVIQRFSNATLLEASPITGRTHQIRVHAAFMGHAIVGDDKYGKRLDNKSFVLEGSNRLFLHAKKLVIPQIEAPDLIVECELDKELLQLLANLQTN